MWRSLASARTDISLSTIRPPISMPRTLTSSSTSMKRAVASRLVRHGLPTYRRCQSAPFQSTRASAMGIVAGVIGMVGLSLACGGVNDLWVGVDGHDWRHCPRARGAFSGRHRRRDRNDCDRPGRSRGDVLSRPRADRTDRASRTLAFIFLTAFGFGLMHFDFSRDWSCSSPESSRVGERATRRSPRVVAAHVCNNAAFVALASFGAAANGTSRGGDVVVIAAELSRGPAPPPPSINFALRADKRSAIE